MLAVSDLDVTIHDSLAILEFLVEEYPEKALYPTDKKLRALARSISNEMHSGFRAVTGNYPVNYLVRYGPGVPLASGAQKALDRLCEIWEGARTVTEKELGQEDGGFLFGGFTIPDAMYWPILWVRISHSRDHWHIEDLEAN